MSRRPMNAEERKNYEDCIDCKISLDEYKDKLIAITLEQGKKLTNLFAADDEIGKGVSA